MERLPLRRMSPNKGVLEIIDVRTDDAGEYKCNAYDGQTVVTATVTVNVEGMLRIITCCIPFGIQVSGQSRFLGCTYPPLG